MSNSFTQMSELTQMLSIDFNSLKGFPLETHGHLLALPDANNQTLISFNNLLQSRELVHYCCTAAKRIIVWIPGV